MNIQQFIDRKRIAGAREHEGRQTDWKDWTGADCLAAVAGELLDAYAYNNKLCEIEDGKTAFLSDSLSFEIYALLKMLPVSALEAACQESEQEAVQNTYDLPTLIRAKVAARGPMDWSQFIGALSDLTDEEVKSLSEEKFDDTLAALLSMPADDLFNCPKCGADYHYLDEESCMGRENEEDVEFVCSKCEEEFTITIHWRYMVEVKKEAENG